MTCFHTSFIFFILSMIVILQGYYINDDACVANEEYSQCGTQCQRTCADVNQLEKPCSHMCATGCFCIEGYVRNDNNNRECIKETEC